MTNGGGKFDSANRNVPRIVLSLVTDAALTSSNFNLQFAMFILDA